MGMLKKIIDKITSELSELKYGLNQCVLCSNETNSNNMLCKTCYQDLPKVSNNVKNNLLHAPNIYKHVSHQHFDCLCCLAAYQWPYNEWISQLKYQQQFNLANLLAKLLVDNFSELFSEQLTKNNTAIIPVPIHYSRWKERGYNQSELIAKKVADYAQVNYQNNYLARHKATEKQVGKNGVERRKNIKNAFTLLDQELNKKPDEKITLPEHIILIDDVITTGTTVNEIARILKKHHVKTITVLTVAIAIDKLSAK